MGSKNCQNIDIESDIIQNVYMSFSNDINNTHLKITTIGENSDPLNKFAADLNKDQKRAYFLICDHRQRNQINTANKPTQLLLYLSGAGGTGKSKVINAISSYFEYTSQRDTLLILAPTGIAA